MYHQSNTMSPISGRDVRSVLAGIVLGVTMASVASPTGMIDWTGGIPMGIGVCAPIGIALSLARRDLA